ncbi:acylneuraminate cytidylyltransferase family protein [Helicobacter sp. 23-1045]
MVLALIPARAGSKSIKNKNLALLGDKPLLFYTLDSAKKARCVDKIVVSSDGGEILDYATSQGVFALNRPKELAGDFTQTSEVVAHALGHFRDFDEIIILQPTSPFRDSADIESAYKIFKSNNANALISVECADNKILKAFIANENGELRGICDNQMPFMPRQKLPKVYQSNGAIYIIKKDAFLAHNTLLPPKTHFYEMGESLDIDTPSDLQRANEILKTEDKDENSKCE